MAAKLSQIIVDFDFSGEPIVKVSLAPAGLATTLEGQTVIVNPVTLNNIKREARHLWHQVKDNQ